MAIYPLAIAFSRDDDSARGGMAEANTKPDSPDSSRYFDLHMICLGTSSKDRHLVRRAEFSLAMIFPSDAL